MLNGGSLRNRYSQKDGYELEPPVDSTRLLIDGVAESCPNEMINLYITLIFNANLDDSLKLEEIKRNRRRVLLKFNRVIDFEEVLARQKRFPDLSGHTLTFYRIKVPNTVRVTELPNSCTKEILNLYFSNTKISSGGEIRSIKMFPYENKALVEFKNYLVVDDVINRSHILSDCLVKLEKYYGAIENEYFFEEEEQSKEKDVKSDLIESSKDKLKKRAVNNLTSLRSFSGIDSSIDRTKIVISNLQENVNIQHLDMFVQLVTGRHEVNEINWSLDQRGKILIDFKKEIDVNKILYEFNNNSLNNLNGRPVQIETVNLTRTIVVLVKGQKVKRIISKLGSSRDDEEYIPENIPATRDLLDLYFVNKQRSGGGEVELVERKTSRHWLVVLKDQRIVRDILSRKHIVDEKPIKVFPYYENFGLPYIYKPIYDDFFDNPSGNAAIFKLKVKDERLRYFSKVKSLHRKLNDILAESNAISRFNKNESSILYVNYIEKVQTKIPYMERMWRLRAKEGIEYFLQVHKYEKLTLSFNQWATISKTKQMNDSVLNHKFEDDDVVDLIDNNSVLSNENKIKYVGSNCAIVSINETASNVEINIVGSVVEVDKFIVKIKDIICKAYFTFELEEKIIKFKTYLYECEELLAKWLSEANEENDSDSEIPLGRGASESDRLSITFSRRGDGVRLNKSRRHTIDEFISKLERDHLDMELSYGKLFQELGYTFLSSNAFDDVNEEDDDDYKEFNDRTVSNLDEALIIKQESGSQESQMDKIKYTLDDLRSRINDMRRKFRQFSIKSKRNKPVAQRKSSDISDEEEDYHTDDEGTDFFKLCVFVKEQGKIIAFRINRRCKIKELKQILFEKVTDPNLNSVEQMFLTYNTIEMTNDDYSINDYGIGDKATITLSFLD